MFRTKISFLLCLAIAGLAAAQSFNIDINRPSGAGALVPSSSYGAAAGQPGVWNNVDAGTSAAVPLSRLDGSSSGVTITRGGNSPLGDADSVSGSSSDFGRLMFDYVRVFTPNHEVTYTLNGLQPGLYRVYLYAALPGASGTYTTSFGTFFHENFVSLSRNGMLLDFSTTSGEVVADTFTEGVTHYVANVAVPVGGAALTLRSGTSLAYSGSYAAINGLQVIRYAEDHVHVSSTATGAQNGTSWADAFKSLHDATDLAKDSGGYVKEIWVKSGVYKPAASDRTASFKLVDDVAILGGFAGNETVASQRDPALNPTTLSGEIGFLITVGDNSYHVVDASSVASTAILDGFHVSRGNANGTSTNDGGGGIYVRDGSPTIRNCVIEDNRGGVGGGVNVESTVVTRPSFERCTFRANIATFDGGGLRFVGPFVTLPAPAATLSACRFYGNSAAGDGGAIYVQGDLYMASSIVDGNSANRGGALFVTDTGVVADIRGSTIVANSAPFGGGLYLTFSGQAIVSNSIFWSNTAGVGVTTSDAQIRVIGTAAANVSYTCVQTGGLPFAGTANIGQDPLFVDADGANGIVGDTDDDLRLQDVSTCVDRGSNTGFGTDRTDIDRDGFILEAMPQDVAGLARSVDGNGDFLNRPDMGAHEAPNGPFNRTYPGTLEDFVLYVGVNGVTEAVAGHDVHMVQGGDVLHFQTFSPAGTFNLYYTLLGAQVFITGNPPYAYGGLAGLHLNDQGGFVVIDGALSPTGLSAFAVTPAGLAGFSVMMQSLVAAPFAQNGIYAATDGQEVRFF